MTWIPIKYRDFYDIPRAFVVEREGIPFYFDGGFDDRIDEYPDRFRVYRLMARPENLDSGSWEGIADTGTFLGEVPVSGVKFDPTRRAAIEDSVFGLLSDQQA